MVPSVESPPGCWACLWDSRTRALPVKFFFLRLVRHETECLTPWRENWNARPTGKTASTREATAVCTGLLRPALRPQLFAFVRMKRAKQQAHCGNFRKRPSVGKGRAQRCVLKRSPIAWLYASIMRGSLPLKVNGSQAV